MFKFNLDHGVGPVSGSENITSGSSNLEKSAKQLRIENTLLEIQRLTDKKDITHIVKGEAYLDPYNLIEIADEKMGSVPEEIQDSLMLAAMILDFPYLYRDYDDRTGTELNPVDSQKYIGIKTDIIQKVGINEATFLTTNKLEASNFQTFLRSVIDIAQKLEYKDLEEELEAIRETFHGYHSESEYNEAVANGHLPKDPRGYAADYGYNYKSRLNDTEKIELVKKGEQLAEQVLMRLFNTQK